MADDIPEFDPSKPFEPAEAAVPEFDPNKSYETVGAEPSTVKDVGKSFVSGIGKGITGLAGLPGDIAGLFPEEWRDAPDKRLPTSQQTQEVAEKVTGKFYEPQTTAGKYAHTVGEFVPGVVGAPGGIAAKATRYALVPGLATEAAGQAAEAYVPELEPYVRAGTALATGVRWRLKKGQYLSHEQIADAAGEHYNHPDVKNLVIEPAAASRLRTEVEQGLNNVTRERLAPHTYAEMRELENPLYPAAGPNREGAVTIADIESVRQRLNRQRVNFKDFSGADRMAANVAVEKIDDFLANLKQPDLRSGNATEAVKHLKEARADWSAAKRMEMVDDKIAAAILRAESTYSGQNVENAIRQNLRSLLEPKNKKLRAGWTDEELARVNSIVKGGHLQNFLREVGNRLGGNLGLWGGLGESVIYGKPHLAALWGTGRLSKWAGNVLARRHAEKLSEMLSERSPEGRMFRQLHPLPKPGIDRPIQMGVGLGQLQGPEQFKKGGRVTKSFRYPR